MRQPQPNPPACEYEQEISTSSGKKRKSKHHSFCCNFGVIKYLLTYGWLERKWIEEEKDLSSLCLTLLDNCFILNYYALVQ